MNIILVNGIPDDDQWRDHESALENLAEELENQGAEVAYFPIQKMNFQYCQGCWDCWTRTPGQCRIHDDGEAYLRAFSKADTIVFFTPIIAGFISSEAKRALDRFIPSVLPHISMYRGESHHLQRYPEIQKRLGIAILDNGNINQKSVDIVFRNFERVGRNMRSDKAIRTLFTPENQKEVLHEILSA